MEISEEDIDFKLIDWKQFEELCFDLLMKYQFHSLVWRQGGADSGRDIECVYTTSNPLIGPYDEKWFVECKHHTAGVSVNDIADKVSWAEVEEGVEHFLLVTSSYITVPAREWLSKKQGSTPGLKIHWIEGKQLARRILSFPDIVIRYFADDYTKLVKSLYKQWVYHDILPDSNALYKLYVNLDPRRLNHEELGFLWYVFYTSKEAVENFCEDEEIELFSFDFLLPYIRKALNHSYPIVSKEEEAETEIGNFLGSGTMHDNKNDLFIGYVHDKIDDVERLQVYIKRENKLVRVRIAVGKK